MKNKLTQLLILVITTIMFSSCYEKEIRISDLDIKTQTVYLTFLIYKEPYDGFIYYKYFANVPISKLDSFKSVYKLEMDSALSCYKKINN